MAGRKNRVCWLFAAASLVIFAGCSGQDNPFHMAQVSGKITYAGGAPIDAAVVTVFLVPQNVPPVGNKYPRPAQTQLLPDGRMSDFSTVAHNDGVLVGRHKVMLRANNSDHTLCPMAVAKKYLDAATTPLEVEVTANGPNEYELIVEKGALTQMDSTAALRKW